MNQNRTSRDDSSPNELYPLMVFILGNLMCSSLSLPDREGTDRLLGPSVHSFFFLKKKKRRRRRRRN
jgi:hypothetical protein